jgi:hypothetical protein
LFHAPAEGSAVLRTDQRLRGNPHAR